MLIDLMTIRSLTIKISILNQQEMLIINLPRKKRDSILNSNTDRKLKIRDIKLSSLHKNREYSMIRKKGMSMYQR